MTLRPSPVFKPWLLDIVRAGDKTQTRRLKPCGKSGDFWYFREGIEKGPTGLAHFRNDKAHVRTAEGACVRWRWKRDILPSIHMPAVLARSFALVLEHRQERLQAISEDDAESEGIGRVYLKGGPREYRGEDGKAHRFEHAREGFRHLWELIHGPYAWTDNPMVHVYRFRLATRAEALAQ